MQEITLGKLFEVYVDIFNKFGIHLLNETDETICYYVYEETDINIGYCSKRILEKFLEEGFIDEDISDNSLTLLEKFRELERSMLIRNAESVKNSPEWRKLMVLSVHIKKMIKNKWTEEELQSVFEFEQLTDILL